MRILGWIAIIAGLTLVDWDSFGTVATDYTFLVSAQVAASPPQITLSWPAKSLQGITIHRKLPTENAWSGPVANLAGNATSFTDQNVAIGQAYEYQLSGMFTDGTSQIAYGYLCAGIQIPAQERRGRVVLIVDNTHASALANELETLRKDFVGDGWTVARYDVSPSDSVGSVKAHILDEYNADPANVQAVFLLGHVPVPYSGLINPDLHDDHLGAWPSDVYYGEMHQPWTDQTVNREAWYPDNDNFLGDGKFDQSTIPGPVELEVGRADLWNLPSFAPRSERDLLRNYLNKNHNFRHRVKTLPLRGLVRDNFGVIDQDAPAVDAWRAYPALFGKGAYLEVGYNQFFSTLASQGYLWAYAGGGGSFTKADGVGTTSNFVSSDPKAAFFLLHGSYFGDWNNADNFLRASLATPTYSVVSIWSGIPHWYFHHLALGETIGYATRLTQNNPYGSLYRNQVELSNKEVHISMLGDPTLRPLPLAPPGNLRISAGTNLTFYWDPSWQLIDGYNLYHSDSNSGPFERVNRQPISGTTFSLALPPPGHHVYMLRAAALQTTGSGSFNNLSQGVFAEIDRDQPVLPQISITATDPTGDENGDPITFQLTRTVATDSAVTVNLQYSGTATPGDDFAPTTSVSFQPGAATATFSISPLQDNINELDESIIVTIAPSADYTIAAPSSATATILGSGQSQFTSVKLLQTGEIQFAATGFANQAYHIEARSPETGWQSVDTGTADANARVTFTAPPNSDSRWYRIAWE